MTTDSAVAEEGAPVDLFGLVGTVLDRKFKVEKIVAEGGFGVVYYGVHLTLERPIAIKVLKTPPEFNERARAQFIEKFALEGKTMARISHPNIVQVLDFGASAMPSGELAPWMVLEWLTGHTLESLLMGRRNQGLGRFSPQEAFAVMKPVLEALAYAHDEGIAHRDIKPANMMVVESKRGSTVRLMDFGIAKLMEDGESAGSGATKTRTTMNAFSPQYAAPEQISGTRTGPWTDVHALALILVEMLTGKTPYDGEDMTQLFTQILSPQRPTPGVRGGVDVGAWEAVIGRALTMKPDDRYKNAGEFLTALESSLMGSSASATGTFQALQQGATGLPTGVGPSPSPTTLRGSATSSGLAVPQQKSSAALFAGIGAAVVMMGIGVTIALTRGGNSNRTQPVPVHAAGNGSGIGPVGTVVPVVVPTPTTPAPIPTVVPPTVPSTNPTPPVQPVATANPATPVPPVAAGPNPALPVANPPIAGTPTQPGVAPTPPHPTAGNTAAIAHVGPGNTVRNHPPAEAHPAVPHHGHQPVVIDLE